MKEVKVYGYRHIETGKVYIGLERPGKSFYISSSSNEDYWRDYSKGMLRYFTLYKGIGDHCIKVAEALEWFALDYAFKTLGKDKLYNSHNNAHNTNESLLTVEDKTVIVDWIEVRSNGIVLENTFEDERQRISEIVERINNKIYSVEKVSLDELSTYSSNQVRVEQYIRSHVNDIARRIEENPSNYEKVDPIIVAVSKDEKTILDGNNTKRALDKVRGINEAPVIFINETEFGETVEQRTRCYNLFGLMMNREPDIVRMKNTDSDIKRQIDLLLVHEGLDLTNTLHEERARQLVEDFFLGTVIPTKQKLNGLWKSYMTDFNKGLSEKYRQNMKVYSESQLTNYCWKNYEKESVACIYASMNKVEHAQALGYICRRMKNANLKKGAIVLYYKDAYEYHKYSDGSWLKDLRDTVEHMKLKVTVDVLPAFNEAI